MPVLTDKTRELANVARDPVRFARGVLGHDVWEIPAAILATMAQPHARAAVKACHASSKTFTAAELTVWALARYSRCKVVTTAPTWHQVETLLWGEIHKTVQSSRIAFPTSPNETEWVISRGVRFAEGLSTTEAERFQGFHADDEGGVVILIIDEAPGVRPAIFEAIAGIRAGGDVRVLMLGNPTIPSGPFFDAFTSQRQNWITFTIGAFDTPNLAGLTLGTLLEMTDDELDDNSRPYLITRRWVQEMYGEWGPDHPLWQARVMGQFPTEADDQLYPLSWLEGARLRPMVAAGGRRQAGLDVAGPGEDETVLYVREGPSVVDFAAWTGKDPRGDVAAKLHPHRNQLDSVVVDVTAIGYYMAQHLKDLGYPVREWNAGGEPEDKERFRRAKDEAAWALRDRLQRGELGGLVDDRTISQAASIKYHHTPSGQVEVESKEDMANRGVKSPDRAEALMLACVVTSRRTRTVTLPGGRTLRGYA